MNIIRTVEHSGYQLIITPSLIQEKDNDISLYLGLFEKSPTVLRKALVTTPYSGSVFVNLKQFILFSFGIYMACFLL